MDIQLKKFGTTLISRQSGQESYNAYKASLDSIKKGEDIFVDFKGVITFTPSWGDEFLTPLQKTFGKNLKLKNTKNLSVKSTLELLEDIHNCKFKIV